jgi:hypothetical protein
MVPGTILHSSLLIIEGALAGVKTGGCVMMKGRPGTRGIQWDKKRQSAGD